MAPINSGPVYTANRRLFLDKEGNVVEADNPDRVELLVGAGGTLPNARAAELGLSTSVDNDEDGELPEPGEEQTPEEYFNTLTVKQLRGLAFDGGITSTSGASKAQIIEMILAHPELRHYRASVGFQGADTIDGVIVGTGTALQTGGALVP